MPILTSVGFCDIGQSLGANMVNETQGLQCHNFFNYILGKMPVRCNGLILLNIFQLMDN
jgi:hypothetical protein